MACPDCYNDHMAKDEKLQKFTGHLAGDKNTLAIILFGSYARGNSSPDSDIDLLVILKDGYKRAVEYFEKQAFEIIYTTEPAAVEYWQNNRHDAVGLWNVAKILFDRDGTGERLKEFGTKLCKEIPSEVSESTLAHLRFDFEDSLKAVERIRTSDPATASLLLQKKMLNLIDLYFDLKRVWRLAPKQQLEHILIQDAGLGKMFQDFYTGENLDQQLVVAKNIGFHIFGL